jgi:hypothetical protein
MLLLLSAESVGVSLIDVTTLFLLILQQQANKENERENNKREYKRENKGE